jgi:hypothetical protein
MNGINGGVSENLGCFPMLPQADAPQLVTFATDFVEPAAGELRVPLKYAKITWLRYSHKMTYTSYVA